MSVMRRARHREISTGVVKVGSEAETECDTHATHSEPPGSGQRRNQSQRRHAQLFLLARMKRTRFIAAGLVCRDASGIIEESGKGENGPSRTLDKYPLPAITSERCQLQDRGAYVDELIANAGRRVRELGRKGRVGTSIESLKVGQRC